jgi:hypothetical protein
MYDVCDVKSIRDRTNQFLLPWIRPCPWQPRPRWLILSFSDDLVEVDDVDVQLNITIVLALKEKEKTVGLIQSTNQKTENRSNVCRDC